MIIEGYVTNSAVTQPPLIWRQKIRSNVEKNLLIKRVNAGLPAPSRPRQYLASNSHEADELEFEIIFPNNKKYENNKLSKISSTSFLFDFGFRIQIQNVRLAW